MAYQTEDFQKEVNPEEFILAIPPKLKIPKQEIHPEDWENKILEKCP